jgi:hypothetical protein
MLPPEEGVEAAAHLVLVLAGHEEGDALGLDRGAHILRDGAAVAEDDPRAVLHHPHGHGVLVGLDGHEEGFVVGVAHDVAEEVAGVDGPHRLVRCGEVHRG